MTTPEKETLINDLIKENRDCTIRYYLETVVEIESIWGERVEQKIIRQYSAHKKID